MPKYGYKLVLVENYVEECAYLDAFCMFRPIGAIIKIEIPDDAKIVESFGYLSPKCRCSKCKFVRVEGYYKLTEPFGNEISLMCSLDKESRICAKDFYKMMKNKRNIAPNKTEPIKFVSLYDNSFEYIKGKDIYPDCFNDYNYDDGCTNGIHYFYTVFGVKKFFEIMLHDFLMRCIISVEGD